MDKKYIVFKIPAKIKNLNVKMRELFNPNHDPENGQFIEGGGSYGGTKGVTYKYESINSKAGTLHPMVSKSGISAMKSDFEKAGMTNYPLTKATDEQIGQMVGEMNNNWDSSNRNEALTKLAKAHLTKIGTPEADTEEQLNKWGLSGVNKNWFKQ